MSPLRRALLLALTLGGCRSGLRELEGGVDVALRRGASWMTYKVRLPHVVGPRGSLTLRDRALKGEVDGRLVNLTAKDDVISGQAGGSVEVDIEGPNDALEVSGVWNGTRVHFTITPSALRGTIARVGGDPNAGPLAGAAAQCQYVLDRVEGPEVRAGISICTGMPEETRLEVPAKLREWLTRDELLMLLLVVFSSPPPGATE